MQKLSNSLFRRGASIVCTIVFLAAASNAATHVINFGGSLGNTYSPSSLNVQVGDTIQWKGSFSFHPLSSKAIPAGAASFHNATGSVFSYPVTVVGTYNYQCDDHVGLGMIGSFTAGALSGVSSEPSLQPHAFGLGQNYPNPFNPATVISFELPVASNVTLKIYNLIGQEVSEIVNENLAAGSYSKTWNAASMPSGVYFYRMSAVPSAQQDLVPANGRGGLTASFTATKKLIVTK
jgi:plastocyanin